MMMPHPLPLSATRQILGLFNDLLCASVLKLPLRWPKMPFLKVLFPSLDSVESAIGEVAIYEILDSATSKLPLLAVQTVVPALGLAIFDSSFSRIANSIPF